MNKHLFKIKIVFSLALMVIVPCISHGQDSLGINKTCNDSIPINVYPNMDTNKIKPLKDTLKPGGTKVNVWGTVGLNVTGGLVGLNISRNKNLYSIHYLQYQYYNSSELFSGGTPDPQYKEVGLLYGIILTGSKRKFYSSIAAGISHMIVKEWVQVGVIPADPFWGTPASAVYEDRVHSIYGVPVKYEIMYRRKYFGIGLDLIANINSNNNYMDLKFHVSLGKLK